MIDKNELMAILQAELNQAQKYTPTTVVIDFENSTESELTWYFVIKRKEIMDNPDKYGLESGIVMVLIISKVTGHKYPVPSWHSKKINIKNAEEMIRKGLLPDGTSFSKNE